MVGLGCGGSSIHVIFQNRCLFSLTKRKPNVLIPGLGSPPCRPSVARGPRSPVPVGYCGLTDAVTLEVDTQSSQGLQCFTSECSPSCFPNRKSANASVPGRDAEGEASPRRAAQIGHAGAHGVRTVKIELIQHRIQQNSCITRYTSTTHGDTEL